MPWPRIVFVPEAECCRTLGWKPDLLEISWGGATVFVLSGTRPFCRRATCASELSTTSSINALPSELGRTVRCTESAHFPSQQSRCPLVVNHQLIYQTEAQPHSYTSIHVQGYEHYLSDWRMWSLCACENRSIEVGVPKGWCNPLSMLWPATLLTGLPPVSGEPVEYLQASAITFCARTCNACRCLPSLFLLGDVLVEFLLLV